MTAAEAPLAAALEEARRRGFLGPGEVQPHIDHARGFADASGPAPPSVIDLGSGGGLPGLVLAWDWPTSRVTLLEGATGRAAVLSETVERLGLARRVTVIAQRGEEAAHDPGHREQFDVAVARSFGVPAVTAEVAAGFVRVGGLLVVAEPPEPAPERWPAGAAGAFGFEDPEFGTWHEAHFARLRKLAATPDGVPRRTGIPAKRPRW